MANSGIFVNPFSKNITNTERYELDKLRQGQFPIFLAQVMDIDLETRSIAFKTMQDAFFGLEKLAFESIAIPLNPNFCQQPIRGEIVLIFYFGGGAYYLTLNYNNNITENQELLENSLELSKKLNSSNKTFNMEGRSVDRTNVSEGDILIEGRFGQSLKLGSTVKYLNTPQNGYSKSDVSENGDPITILRNGVNSFDENIALDDSSIYLCSTQKIQLDTNENGLEAILAEWSTLNVNNKVVESTFEEVGTDIHNDQSPVPAPVPAVAPAPVGTPAATLPPEANTKTLAMLIGYHESNNMYDRIVNTSNASIVRDESILNMTVAELDKSKYGRPAFQNGASVGRFQIQSRTALDVLRANKKNPNSFKFDATGQDALFEMLLNRRGKKKYLAGEISETEFANNIAHEWASMPADASGNSAYGGNNRALVGWDEFLKAIRGLKKNVRATPVTSPVVTPRPPANTPKPPPPADQPGYTSVTTVDVPGTRNITISNLPKLPKKYQRYRQGVAVGDPVEIYVLDGVPVTAEVAEVFSKMKKDAWEQDKVVLKLNSGFRAMEDIVLPNGNKLKGQNTLWEELNRDTSVVARPGFSNHQNGIAMDIQVADNRKAYKWLVRNALKYQVVRAVPKERWHWEYRSGVTTAFVKVPRSHPTWDGLADGLA